MKIQRGTVNVLAEGERATLAELAKVPDAARGLGIPPEAAITHISLNHGYRASFPEDSRQAELTIGWEMPQ